MTASTKLGPMRRRGQDRTDTPPSQILPARVPAPDLSQWSRLTPLAGGLIRRRGVTAPTLGQ